MSPEEGFLLSRIDGQTSWSLLREIGGLPPERVDRCLERWLAEGLLVVGGSRDLSPGGSDAVDPDLDLSVELQREILAFEGRLGCSYHELLGVERDADGKAIKRAYFALSRKFHPDRYFRKQIGGFRLRLEKIFKNVAEAYELLSDPATRAEVERHMVEAAEPEAPPVPESEPGPRPQSSRRETLERLRQRFRIPKRLVAERKLRARQFYEASRSSYAEGRWLEAAASARLAIAFDPWESRYKQGFSEVQVKVYEYRAAALLEQSDELGDVGVRQEALRLYEEVVHFRPGDAAVQHQAARLALGLGELEKAREYADAACEIAPEVAAHHVVRCAVLRKLGDLPAARRALGKAESLDPQDSEMKEERRALRRAQRR